MTMADAVNRSSDLPEGHDAWLRRSTLEARAAGDPTLVWLKRQRWEGESDLGMWGPLSVEELRRRAQASGCYLPPPEDPPERSVEEIQQEREAAAALAKAEAEVLELYLALPRPSEDVACDYLDCRGVAVGVWWRTAADVAASKGAKHKLLPKFKACANHITPWRKWVGLREARPSEAPVVKKKKHCATCSCAGRG